MSQRSAKYNLALIRNLQANDYLQADINPETIARLMQQYVQGAISHARVNRDLKNIKRDLPEGVYRIIGLKPEFWFTTKPTWPSV